MSEPKFTPGPWNVAPMDLRMFRITRDLSCWVDICRNVLTEENANLIAAAPEMYSMLERILDYMTGGQFLAKPPSVKEIAHLLEEARGER